jgi:cbb3-type cytochrome oxidase subunit 3
MVHDPLKEEASVVVIQVPDVSWDINRVESSKIANSPATSAATPYPELSSKQIDILDQINILPTYYPSPSPTSSAPRITLVPTSVSSIIITTSFPTTIITEGITSDDKSRTFFSCPPPPPQIVQHGESIIEIETHLSTVRISFGFHVQTQDTDIRTILPAIERQMEQTLGEYMKSHTEDGYDESSCSGFYIEDFRRRRRTRTRRKAMAEELPTKIIALSSAEDLSLDKYLPCEETSSSTNTNCFIVKGALDASYIGNNEVGVTSSISRLIKTEVVINQTEYDIEYIDVNNDVSYYGYTTPDTADFIPTIVSSLQESDLAINDDDDESGGITIYGAGILVALGLAFIGVVYVAFIKGNKQRRTKLSRRHEVSDDLSDKVNHYPTNRQKSITPDLENNIVRSSRPPRGMKWQANDRDRSVKKPKKMNPLNKSDDDAIVAIPDETSNGDGSCEVSAMFKRPFRPPGKDVLRSRTSTCTTNSINNNCDSSITRRTSNMEAESHNISAVSIEEAGGDSSTKKNEQWPLNKGSIIPLVDRYPSSVSSIDVALGSPTSIGGRSRIHFLPSISEADLSPSMKDTPSVHSPKKLSRSTSGINRCTSHSSNYSNECEESEI